MLLLIYITNIFTNHITSNVIFLIKEAKLKIYTVILKIYTIIFFFILLLKRKMNIILYTFGCLITYFFLSYYNFNRNFVLNFRLKKIKKLPKAENTISVKKTVNKICPTISGNLSCFKLKICPVKVENLSH